MAIDYVWHLSNLETIPSKTIDGVEYTDLVKTVHWRMRAQDGAHSVEEYGSIPLDTDNVDAATFAEFSDLTPATIAGWAKVLIDASEPGRVDAMKARLADKISALKTPTVVNKLPSVTEIDDSLVGA